MDGIMANGHVIRGWIGVETQDITADLAENFGVKEHEGALIAAVLRGGPADKAGVKPGDILVQVNDAKVTDQVVMVNLIAQLAPDKKARLTFIRKGKPVTLEVLIGTRQPGKFTPNEDEQDEDGQH